MKKEMTNWLSAFCTANGIQIHYTRTGGSKPPLILLHGLNANGDCWSAQARAFEIEYDVIMPDARGHGKSSAPDFGYSYDDHVNDIIGLIKVLELNAPILIGHSMGGMTAAVAVSNNPKLFSGLVLADPPFISPKVQREVRDSDVSDQHRRTLKKSFDDVLSEIKIRHPQRSVELLEQCARAQLQTSIYAFDVLTPPYPDYKQLISKLEVPSLIVLGDAGVVSMSLAEELRKLNPVLQIEKIDNAGHGLHYDQPERFSNVVKSFLLTMKKGKSKK